MVFEDLYSAQATFRGFRGQTLYILSRIINDNEKFKYHPEGMEDLDIFFENELKELIQVKFYTNNLTLSDLDPEKESSFLKRSLRRFKDGLNPKIKLVSLGPVGPELKNAFKTKGKDRSKIESKLRNKGYKNDEINLIFNKIKIIELNENKLKEKIVNYLKTKHTGFDPENSFNLLMNWIYQSSEKAEVIDKYSLIDRLNNVATFLSERYNFIEEYGRSIRTITPVQKVQNYEKLAKEFYMGISARYEHIIADLDVKRQDKLYEIKKKIEENNVIIIHGASGQGKSTLAYRFLYEYYPDDLIYQIISKDRDVLPIITTLHAISKSIDDNIALYIDVEPGDTAWPDIVKNLNRYPQFHIFVTIREEDWNRSTLSNDLIFSEVELKLNEEEAENIYDNLTSKKPDKEFLDFEDSWLKFGGKGPLLEFTYLITQGSTLREKLKSQIKRISDESTETERLNFLRIVSIIGMYGGKTDLKSIKSIIKLKDPVKVIESFQKEYLIRKSGNGRFIEPLHPIRSKILVEILSDPIFAPVKEDIKTCISVIDERDLEIFLLNCFLKYGADEKILRDLNSFKPKTWTGYGLIIKSLLWVGIKNYVNINNCVISEAHKKFGSSWYVALFTDLSDSVGVNQIDINDIDFLPNEFKEESRSLRNKLQDKKLIYEYLRIWLKNTDLPSEKLELDNDWSYAGFSLFWLSKMGILKKLNFSDLDLEKSLNSVSLESLTDFVLGLYYFEPTNILIKDKRVKILERFKKELLVPLIYDDGKKITLNCIIDVTEAERSKDMENFVHEKIMERITLIRKLYPEREKFASKCYGSKLSFLKLDWDDTEKTISLKNLPLKWLTEINATFIALVDYQYRPDSWGDYVQNVIKTREDSLNLIKKLLKNFKIYFKTRKFVNVLTLNDLATDWDKLSKNLEVTLFPKNAVDPWGFSSENKEQQLIDKINQTESEIMASVNLKKFNSYTKVYNTFISNLRNYFNQASNVIYLQCLSKGKNTKGIEKMKEELISKGIRTDFNRLSVLNLWDAYKNLLEFQTEFEYHFKKYISIDFKEESTNYAILTEVWRIFALNNFKLNQNIIKSAQNTLVNEKINIFKYVLTILEKENLNVTLIPKSFGRDKENFLIFNINNCSQMDETIVTIINTLNNGFKCVEWTELKKLFLDIEFPYFRIIILVKHKLIFPNSFNYPLSRALTSNNNELDMIDLNPHILEETQIKELALEKWSDYVPEILEIQKGLKCEELQHLVYHLKQLLELKFDDDIGFKITQEYTNKISKKIEKDFQDLLDFLAFVKNKSESYVDNILKSSNTVSPELKSELIKVANLIKESHENLYPKKPDGSKKVKLNIKLDLMGEWYNRLEKSKKAIYTLYYYFIDQLIAEY